MAKSTSTHDMWDGLVRIRVRLPRTSTSVSLDDVLFQALSRLEGGEDAAKSWIRKAAFAVEEAERRGLAGPIPLDVNAGMSRLVQRLVLRHVLGEPLGI